MATKKAPKGKEPSQDAPDEKQGLLETAAKAIGSTIGTIAATTGIVHPPAKAATPKRGKLQKQNKKRMPRKAKKRLKVT
jgi:hypothetical protein